MRGGCFKRQAGELMAQISRRAFLAQGLGLLSLAGTAASEAATHTTLQVAYAGSMGALMHGGIAPIMAHRYATRIEGRAQGALGLAHMIVAGTIRPDVFISITRDPMDIVLRAGKAHDAWAIASTELVIAYSPRSRFTKALARAAHSVSSPWWKVLVRPGLRFGRTDPLTDPQGVNTIFMLRLAERFYHEPDLARRILGPTINPREIFPEPEVMARLQGGQLDASAAYKTQPAALGLPYLSLPTPINLGDAHDQRLYDSVSLVQKGRILRPQPLVFYASVLTTSQEPAASLRFVHWLRGPVGQRILRHYHYDGPKAAPPLVSW